MEPVKLLWTGGWDSTFRLCQIVLIHKRVVQPYYLIDENRLSLRHEFLAHKKIKDALFNAYPFTRELILPVSFTAISDVNIDPKISADYKTLKKQIHFGSQYEWLAGFCESENITDLELSFENDPIAKKNVFLKPFIKRYQFNNHDITYKIFDRNKTHIHTIFNYYLWPLWDISRKDMVEISANHGFLDIMQLSWFCHTPVRNQPCGRCNPCLDAVKYGFSYRLNNAAKLRYHTRNLGPRAVKAKLLQLKN